MTDMQKQLETFINDFLHHLTHERRLSWHTCVNYRRDLNQFSAFLTALKVSEWSLVTSDQVRSFLAAQRQNKKIARSLNRQISALRVFYRYLLNHRHVKADPMLTISALKMPQLLPKPLDVDQMAQLLTISAKDFFSLRDRALFEVMYSTGLRLHEVTSLNISSLDMTQQKISVIGKGNKARIIFIGAKAKQSLEEWLSIRAEKISIGEEALFINQQGRRLSDRTIQKCLTKRAGSQGILTNAHPHRLRHSFASHLLESSGDLRAVQELLGHANLSSTQIYTKVNFQHLAELYDKCHPRAKKNSKK